MPFDSIYKDYVNKHYYLMMFMCYLIAVLLLQVWGFNGSFYYDSTLFDRREHLLAGGFAKALQVFPQRPIPFAVIYLNYITGGLTPWPFRLVNAVFMALNAVMLSVFVNLIFETPALRDTINENRKKTTAFIIGFFFAIHPIQCHLVLYVWQRAALFASVFYFSALAVYLAVRLDKISNPFVGYVSCFFLGLFALLSKENAVTIPATIVLLEIAFFKTGWKRLVKIGIVLCAAGLVCLYVLSMFERPHGMGEATGILAVLKKYYQEGDITFTQVFMSQCRMLFKYLSLILFPFPGKVQLLAPQLVSVSIFDPETTLPAVMAASAFVAGALVYLRTFPLVCFGFLFFVVALVPESFLVPQYIYIPYRASLPMAGLLLSAAGLVLMFLEKYPAGHAVMKIRKGLIAAGVVYAVLAACVTVSIALLWNNPLQFWQGIVDSLPPIAKNLERAGAAQCLNQLGVELQREGKLEEALVLHEKALSVSLRMEQTYTLLAMVHVKLGHPEEAEKFYKTALRISIDPWLIHSGLARLFADQGRFAESEDQFRKLIEIMPHKPDYHYSLGFILMKQSKFREAVPCFIKTFQLAPKYADAYYQLGKSFLELGKPSEAMMQFRMALEINPDHVPAHLDMGALTASMGAPQQAVDHFKHVLKVEPDNEMAKENLQTAMEQLRESAKQ